MKASDTLEINLLGELSLRRCGAALALPPSRKTRGLLAYLVLNPGRHRREKLCELFWQVPDDPRGSLRWSLSKLRSLVDADGVTRIHADRDAVAFDPGDAVIDLLAIRQRLAGGIAGVDATELAGIAKALSRGCLVGLEIAGQPRLRTVPRQRTGASQGAALRGSARPDRTPR